ncbi:MAG: hypothetical protein WCZ86_05865 [Desulfurivibrionaceae bacterium]|jgi:hypothetical protein
MLDIDPGILAQLASGEIREFSLLKLVISGQNLCFTECDVPIAFNGDLYVPRPYQIGNVSYSLARIVDSAQLSIGNLDDQLTPYFEGGSPQGSPAMLYDVCLDTNYQLIGIYPDDHVVLFSGEIDDWRGPEGAIELTMASDMVQWHRKTLAMQSSSCRWRVFKGVECGYAGIETKCDRSYARCEAYGNTANFGGERWLPSIEDANIWWGQTPEVSA